MFVVLSETDFTKLKPETLDDLRMTLGLQAPSKPQGPRANSAFDWDDVIDLLPDRVEEFMMGCAPETIAGLKVVAECGPIIRADLLKTVGITNYAHFQGRVTKRTRTVTKNRHAFLFGWDDWNSPENKTAGCGHYGVTQITHDALRKYFAMN
jgi:hypothetical protein